MQDKESVDDVGEALARKADAVGDDATRESNKFAFRRMSTPKKKKSDKASASKYEGEGVVFKAKLIGVESVPDPRGDKMCQDAMQRLKLNVRNTGPHKRKINVCVSLQGIKIKDEKMTSEIFHHPVPKISFISQDITDARAFGYVFGSTYESHQFIAIKTEKPAFHVVLALRDLFQTVLNHKQEEIDYVKEQSAESSEMEQNFPAKVDLSSDQSISLVPSISELNVLLQNKAPIQQDSQIKPKEDNIYIEVLATEPLEIKDEELVDTKEPEATIDDLLEMQSELNQLTLGINQMDHSIAAAAAFNSGLLQQEIDPFDTSFVLGAKRNSMPLPLPTPVPLLSSAASNGTRSASFNGQSLSADKYAAFNTFENISSVFEAPGMDSNEQESVMAELQELEEEIARKAAPPAKPPRMGKSASPDLSLFADLDPLGKDRPYVDKAEFFQDVKNPPKKVLNDLVDSNKEANSLSTSVSFPVDFESMPTNRSASASQANSDKSPNPFDNHNGAHDGSATDGMNGTQKLGNPPQTSSLTNPLTVNCNIANMNHSSSPIPIPPRHPGVFKDHSSSNGSLSSPYSKSPQLYSSNSPDQSSYYINNYSDSDSPTGIKNGGSQNHYSNGENGYSITNNKNNSQNGVSRPRPRAALTKGPSIPNGGRTFSSHSLSSDSSSDYDVISRESMQSITNMLLTNGHRLKAQSLYLDNDNHTISSEKTIFAKKADPFTDDFFLPKKIPDCV